MRLPLLLALAGATASGCGDNAPLPDEPEVEPEGSYTHPADFPRQQCAPGGFAGAAPSGIYHLRLDFGGGFSRAVAIRIDDNGTGLGGLVMGDDADVVHRYGDDDVVMKVDLGGGDVTALDLCANQGGEVRGTLISCSPDQNPECGEIPFTGKRVLRRPEPVATGMTLLGELAFGEALTVNVRVADGIAYLARYQDGLQIVDVHDPAHPVALGHVPVEFPPYEIYNDVKLTHANGKTYALMGSSVAGAVVVDVTDPSAPAIAGHLKSTGMQCCNTHTLFVDGERAYLATYGLGLEIWDIADPTDAHRLGTFLPDSGDAYLHDLYVSGDRAYLNFWDLGMIIADVSDPAHVDEVGRFDDYGEYSSHSSWVMHVGDRDLAIHGDEQWGAHVHVVDVTEGSEAFTDSIAEWETRPEVSVHNIMAAGDLAVMSYYQDGVRVLDLSDPEAPTEVAHFQTWPGYDRRYGYNFFEGAVGVDVDVANRIVYVADSHRGLVILRLDA